ncbi:nitroreductase [Marinitoga sp. 1135]|uniref:SagB/ThcOx family dehydrogenase n=1 Tax=unclassified Marinitoga TaxID=2640159 RepID=UPI00158613C5|nr:MULTISPECIES: SagB/ThcOx family dehydrogenase [unclassified Marinitoga]NUU94720.1 nitroreductase [Marinitoga sp. 1135]NUU96649.1 nitroreductase [Marinitoga sp. 1138]
MKCGREVLKSNWKNLEVDLPDRKKGIKNPPYIKPYPQDTELINLPDIKGFKPINNDFISLLFNRQSRRRYKDKPISLEELSYMLFYTQGVKKVVKDKVTFRTVPSAGATHPLETYIVVFNVKGLEKGIYRYIPTEHKLLPIKSGNLREEIIEATLGQRFIGESAVVFVWSAIPYRTEWKYKNEAHKTISIDAGHVCQNLYLLAESINCGTCAVAAYDQDLMDKLIEVDGKDEFVVYLAPIGKI